MLVCLNHLIVFGVESGTAATWYWHEYIFSSAFFLQIFWCSVHYLVWGDFSIHLFAHFVCVYLCVALSLFQCGFCLLNKMVEFSLLRKCKFIVMMWMCIFSYLNAQQTNRNNLKKYQKCKSQTKKQKSKQNEKCNKTKGKLSSRILWLFFLMPWTKWFEIHFNNVKSVLQSLNDKLSSVWNRFEHAETRLASSMQ